MRSKNKEKTHARENVLANYAGKNIPEKIKKLKKNYEIEKAKKI